VAVATCSQRQVKARGPLGSGLIQTQMATIAESTAAERKLAAMSCRKPSTTAAPSSGKAGWAAAWGRDPDACDTFGAPGA
jgi:hypothetical protein